MLRSPCIVTVAVEIVLLLLLLLLLCFLTRGKPLVAQKSTEGNYEIYLVVNLLRPVVINYTWDAVTSVNLNISMVKYLRRHLVCATYCLHEQEWWF